MQAVGTLDQRGAQPALERMHAVASQAQRRHARGQLGLRAAEPFGVAAGGRCDGQGRRRVVLAQATAQLQLQVAGVARGLGLDQAAALQVEELEPAPV